MAFNIKDEELQAFDENQREKLLGIFKRLETEVNPDESEDNCNFGDNVPAEKRPLLQKDQAKLRKMVDFWKAGGRIPGRKEQFSYKELCSMDMKHTSEMKDGFSTDHPLLIPRVISEVVKESIEPNIVLTPMLQRINYSAGTQLTFPAIGAITAADIPEGGEYPERSIDFTGQVIATIGKSGVAIKMTDEMIRYSMYDIMSMHLQAAGKALIRWKEHKVADLITTNAGGTNTLFDNTSTSYSSTTGRDAEGNYNGTLALDDLFRAYATMVNRGFTPNTLIMNPFAWQIFADDGLTRAFGFNNGAAMWQTLQGNLGNAPQWGNGGLLQNTTVSAPQNLATTHTQIPSIFPYPFRIVVSPYMPYNASLNTTDMVLCDMSELGVLVVDEEVQTESWDDPARDIQKVKLRERYGLASVNTGQGTGILKGIDLARNFDFSHNIQANIDVTGLGNALTGDADYVAAIGQ
jgi:HK97 family phage major capsid protein